MVEVTKKADLKLYRAGVLALSQLLDSPDIVDTIGTSTLDLLRREMRETILMLDDTYWKLASGSRDKMWETLEAMRAAETALTIAQDALHYLEPVAARKELRQQVQECRKHLIRILGETDSSMNATGISAGQ